MTQKQTIHATGFQPVVDDGETERRLWSANFQDYGSVGVCPRRQLNDRLLNACTAYLQRTTDAKIKAVEKNLMRRGQIRGADGIDKNGSP
jgi:hypothetical protein